jgi:hypothetical protein
MPKEGHDRVCLFPVSHQLGHDPHGEPLQLGLTGSNLPFKPNNGSLEPANAILKPADGLGELDKLGLRPLGAAGPGAGFDGCESVGDARQRGEEVRRPHISLRHPPNLKRQWFNKSGALPENAQLVVSDGRLHDDEMHEHLVADVGKMTP